MKRILVTLGIMLFTVLAIVGLITLLVIFPILETIFYGLISFIVLFTFIYIVLEDLL